MAQARKRVSLVCLVAVLFLVLFLISGFTSLVGAAIPKSPTGRTPSATAIPGFDCPDRLSNLYLSGSFLMPGTGESMNLWIGKPGNPQAKEKEVWGLVGKPSRAECEAQCKVVRFERFKKDLKPALMELECEGTNIKTLRMPLHVQWVREKNGLKAAGPKTELKAIVRLGSSLYGMEVTPLRVEVNRYVVAAK